MKILFERFGGIAGMLTRATIDLDELPADQRRTLERLLDESHFSTLTESPPKLSAPDEFHYTITLEADSGQHTVHTTETSAPASLRPLLHELTQRARIVPR